MALWLTLLETGTARCASSKNVVTCRPHPPLRSLLIYTPPSSVHHQPWRNRCVYHIKCVWGSFWLWLYMWLWLVFHVGFHKSCIIIPLRFRSKPHTVVLVKVMPRLLQICIPWNGYKYVKIFGLTGPPYQDLLRLTVQSNFSDPHSALRYFEDSRITFEQWKLLDCLGLIGDYAAELYGDFE